MIDYGDAIWSLYKNTPNLIYSITNNNYDELNWETLNVAKPSKAELDAELTRLQAEYDAKQYQRDRATEYPPLTDLADAMYWSSQGDNTKLEAYYAACEAVKQKYPKVL